MKKNKEHKKGESTIGKIIYGFLLFMPLFAIGVSCVACFWNKQVVADTQTATIEYYFDSNEVNTIDDLHNGYTYSVNVNTTDNLYNRIYCSNIIVSNGNTDTLVINNINYVEVDQYYLMVYKSDVTGAIDRINYINNALTIAVTFNSDTLARSNINFTTFTEYTGTNYIKNVNVEETPVTYDVKNIFYYAVDKVTENPLFSWATNSVIYTTMNATCTQLSITTPFIPLILSYWLIISVIYFLYDIALMLIWLLHDKIHEMRDSLA